MTCHSSLYRRPSTPGMKESKVYLNNDWENPNLGRLLLTLFPAFAAPYKSDIYLGLLETDHNKAQHLLGRLQNHKLILNTITEALKDRLTWSKNDRSQNNPMDIENGIRTAMGIGYYFSPPTQKARFVNKAAEEDEDEDEGEEDEEESSEGE
ncbi:hypothetical protein IW261DRAFT_1423612 [Armillaria novae-zelandiae]|uniref:Uncharacterized protein n=1 Tax=Armillaria novae-zelandiae TaxID=153914 RepID=A0AA39T9C0_9AGAR|nr:hypothetical protein IW261DRAFT_1423612 [Armillaria novae-zelandiae]